ncbi:MAG: hypothetical protein WDN04_15860 [Rhodospirillales bacterium]
MTGTASPPAYFGTGSVFTRLSGAGGPLVTDVLGLNDAGAVYGTFQAPDQTTMCTSTRPVFIQLSCRPAARRPLRLPAWTRRATWWARRNRNGKPRAFYAACSGSGC